MARRHRNRVAQYRGRPAPLTYLAAHERAQQLAHALVALGVQPDDRVGTLAWNNHRHFELYYGVSGLGAVCHTINPRLFAEPLLFIINDAADRLLVFDATFLPLVEKLARTAPRWSAGCC